MLALCAAACVNHGWVLVMRSAVVIVSWMRGLEWREGSRDLKLVAKVISALITNTIPVRNSDI